MNTIKKMRRRTTRNTRSVWDDPTAKLNKEAPAVKKMMRREKWKRRVIKFNALVAAPLILLVAIAVFTNATAPKNDTADPAAASTAVNGSYGKAAAFTTVTDWLAAEPAPLPGGTIVSWDGYSIQKAPPPEDENKQPVTYSYETHRFTINSDIGTFAVSVLVAVDGAHQVTVIGTPSPRPLATGEVADQLNPWFGLDQTNASGDVKESAAAWAEVYMSGDADELRRAVQDKNPKHYYIPFVGVDRVESVDVNAAAYIPTDDEGAEPKFMTVRVEVKVWWDGTAPPADEDADAKSSATDEGDEDEPEPATFTYDLLVDDPGSAAPVIVAWGAPGSGGSLKPYQNATDAPVETPDSDASDDTKTNDQREKGDVNEEK